MKNLNKFAAAIIMVVLAVAANTATAQSLSDVFKNITSDSVKTTVDTTSAVVKKEQPTSSRRAVNAEILRFAGHRCLLVEAGAVVSDDGAGVEGKATYFYNKWGFSLHGRYIKDRSGLGVSVLRHLRSYTEARLQPYCEIGFGLYQQYVGVKDDITVDDVNKGTGNLKHQFMIPMLRPQAEAGLGLEFRLSQRSSLKVYGRAGWRFCEKDKLSVDNNINFDHSTVESGKLDNIGKDKLTYNVGITYQIRLFPGRNKK